MTPQAIEREVQLIHGMLRWATRRERKARHGGRWRNLEAMRAAAH